MAPRHERLAKRSTRLSLTALTVCGALAIVCPAHADVSLKKKIFDDCDAALNELKALPADQQAALVPYLAQVIRLETSALGESVLIGLPAPLPPKPSTGPTFDPVPGTEISRTLDPDLELKAKKCAVTALTQLGALSGSALPPLIAAAQQSGTREDLHFALEEAIRSIAISLGKTEEREIPSQLLDQLMDLTRRSEVKYAEITLLELQRASLPYLLSTLRTAEGRRRDIAFSLLLDLDREGKETIPVVVSLLQSADEALRKRAVTTLPQFTSRRDEIILALLGSLQDVSEEVRTAALDALGQLVRGLGDAEITLSPQTCDALIRALANPEAGVREVTTKLLLACPALQSTAPDALLQSLASPVPEVRAASLQLLSASGTPSATVYNKARDLLYDPNIAVRRVAIRTLGKEPSRSSETLAAFLKLLRSASVEWSEDAGRIILAEVSEVIAILPEQKESQALAPILTDALQSDAPTPIGNSDPTFIHPAETALLKIGRVAVPELLRLLKNPRAATRVRAVRVLGQMPGLTDKELRIIADSLRDPSAEVVVEAIFALRRHMPKAKGIVERAVKSGEPRSIFAAEVVGWPATASRLVTPKLSEGLLLFPCRERSSLAVLVGGPSGPRVPVLEPLRECVLENIKEAITAVLLPLASLAQEDQETVKSLVSGEQLDTANRLRLLEKLPELGIPPAQVTSLAIKFLAFPENYIRLRATQLLGRLGPDANEAIPRLQEIVGKDDEEELLQNEALVALYRINPDVLPFAKLLFGELKSSQSKGALSVLEQLPPELVIQVLHRASDELEPDRIIPLVRLVGRNGSLEALPILKTLSERPNAALRFEATIAHANLAPADPWLEANLARELGSFYSLRLDDEKLPEELRPLLERFLASPNSVVQEIMAEKLLAILPRSSGAPTQHAIGENEKGEGPASPGDVRSPAVEGSVASQTANGS